MADLRQRIAGLSPKKHELLLRLLKSKSQDLPQLRPVRHNGKAPLSYAQEGAWFVDQLQPGVPFNIPLAIRLQGPLDIGALELALNAVVRRHEVLRTTFAEVDGQPIQVVAPSQQLSITAAVIGDGENSERMTELLKQLIESARTPFDLSRGPLLQMKIFRLDADDHVLVFTVHHSVFDGWSIGVFGQEIAKFYESYVSGSEMSLPDLPFQYGDYAIWQRELLQGEFLESQLGYWMKQLAEHPAGLSLPTDHPESTARLFHGNAVSIELSRALSDDLRTLGRGERSSLFMVLLAVFKLLLARYSGQDDIVVGTPVSTRGKPGQEGLIGFCVNLLSLRTDLSGNPSFRQLLRRVREVCLGAYSHQELPFGLLVQRLHPDRYLTHSPIFQVQFALQAGGNAAASLPGLRLSAPFSEASLSQELKNLIIQATPATDHLFLNAMDSGANIHLLMHYRSDLFDASTMQRMMRHMRELVRSIVSEPDRPVFEIPILDADELRQVLVDWNSLTLPVPRGIAAHHLFEAAVERAPDAVAVIVPSQSSNETEQKLTYRELNRRANQLAHLLRSHGAGSEVRVGICLERSEEMIVAVLAVLKAGAAYVPLDPSYPDERLHYMLSDARIHLLVTRKGLITQPLPEAVQAIELDSLVESLDEAGEANPNVPFDDQQLAYVIYTSGSTGRPKGVMVSHRSLVNAYRAWEEAYQLRSVRCHLQMASFSFDVFTGDVIRALCSGGTLLLCPHDWLLEPENLYRLLTTYEVDSAEFVPAVVRPLIQYLDQSGQRLDWMKRVIVGSDRWSCWEYEQLLRLAGQESKVTNSYGAAEATIDSSYLESLGAELSGDQPVPIGRPFANTQIYILDSRLQPVPPGVVGELHIAGHGLARGYLNRPDLTAEKFIPNPFSRESSARLYRAGDRGRFLADGNIELLGRNDEQIKIRGFRVEVGEIEAVLAEHAGVREAAVVVGDEPSGGKCLIAYAVVQSEANLDSRQLREFLQQRLPLYMVPSAVMILEKFPLAPNGKLDRRALPAPTSQRQELAETYVEPRSITEKEIAAIWGDELRIDRVGIHDNFFAIGGHSLLAAKVMASVRKKLQTELSLRELFLHPTVAGLAQAVDMALATGSAAPAADIDLEREVELDPSIVPDGSVFKFPAQPARVFLTGASGFLGAFLLHELLVRTEADVYCLVRGASTEDGSRKLREGLEKYGLWEESAGSRVVPVLGDLAAPKLGLTDEQYSDLCQVDAIYHNGALVNSMFPYAMLKAANVLGTEEILRMACHTKIKPVHYISTISVFPPESWASASIEEKWIVDGGNSLRGGYAQSKWVAERRVIIAAERGLPVSIYRPGSISGDSRTGVWIPDQRLIDSLQTILDLGSVPRLSQDSPIDVVPVDYVAQAIVYLSKQPESLGKAFHLVNPRRATWQAFVDRLHKLGSPMRESSPEQWIIELLRFARQTPTNFLNPLLPLVPRDVMARLEQLERTAVSAVQSSAGDPTFASTPPILAHVECSNALRGLEGTEVTCRPVEELLDVYFSYFIRSRLLVPRG